MRGGAAEMRARGRFPLWLGLPALAAAYVLLVLGSSAWLQGRRVDLTQDQLYTLSPGTRRILDGLKQPLDLTLYFSDRASRSLPQLRAYHQRVVDMLDEMARDAHGRIHLSQVDPLAFSEDEDRATAAGLTPVRGEGNGEAIFFGLAGRNPADGRTASIPFFLPAKEPFLEYDLAKLIHDLDIAHKPRVAIFSELPIWGGADASGQDQPPWTVLQQLRQLFDVQRLDASSLAKIDGGIGVLVLIQPRALSDADVHAIDRYVQAGGRLLAFVDPDSEVDGGLSSDLPKLFRAWGIAFDPGRVLLDRARALTVQSPLTGTPVRHPAVLGLSDGELNRHDPVTAALSVIDVSTAGYFGLLPDTATRLEPLIQSTTEAMSVSADTVRNTADPSSLYEGYKPDGEHYAIAVRVLGKLGSAFPGEAGADGAHPARDAQVLLVAERRFTRVDAMRRSADEKFKAKQLELQAELADTEQRLAALRNAVHGQARSAAQKAALEQFTQRKLAIRGELRAVQRQLDADIEHLSMQLKFLDILAMPILLTLIALLYGGVRLRRRRTRQGWR